jgi:hypothetical protein
VYRQPWHVQRQLGHVQRQPEYLQQQLQYLQRQPQHLQRQLEHVPRQLRHLHQQPDGLHQSVGRRALLRLIAEHHPKFVSELAILAGRAEQNVMRTLHKLSAVGLVRPNQGEGRARISRSSPAAESISQSTSWREPGTRSCTQPNLHSRRCSSDE